jgi:hypothetical protein
LFEHATNGTRHLLRCKPKVASEQEFLPEGARRPLLHRDVAPGDVFLEQCHSIAVAILHFTRCKRSVVTASTRAERDNRRSGGGQGDVGVDLGLSTRVVQGTWTLRVLNVLACNIR